MESVGYLLKTAQQRLHRAIDATLRDLGISTSQYAVLTFLDESPGLSSAQLARRAFVTPQTMHRVVASLEAARLIERGPHPELGRVLEATLTPRGRQTLAECHRRVQEVEERMLADLKPAERRQLADLLQCCTRGLGSHRKRPSAKS